jgi:acetyl-CoA C-acetyltransferase
MGLTKHGQRHIAIEEGWVGKNCKLPINPSGGLKSKEHPIAATGVSMHALGASQATGNAGEMQVPNASLVGVFNMGSAAVANYLSILERVG